MKKAASALLLLPLGLCAALSVARSQPLAVFTQGQVDAGKAVYPKQCGQCHGPDMEGGTGPALTGPDFRQLLTEQNRTAQSLLDVIRQTMPYDAPGIDPDEQYNDITAYILSRLGYPAGSENLTPDSPHAAALKLGS